ncbi:MAG: hypothetical protein CL693_13680 [Cellvibrionaceae bacterium]|nr:hypothetical protein [Cellvibrionaceae bacterium]
MTRVYVDMDQTLADYASAYRHAKEVHPDIPYPQSLPRLFEGLAPITGAIDGYRTLEEMGFDVWVLSAPSYMNPLCYTEKRLWIEKHLGLNTCKKLILSIDKSLLIGDYLIDDYDCGKGQENFRGQLIHFGTGAFPDWMAVITYFEEVVSSSLK